MTKDADKAEIVPVSVQANKYPVDAGYTLVSHRDNVAQVIASAKIIGGLVAGTAINLIGRVGVSLHHGHSRPSNYSNVLIEQRYRLYQQQKRAYTETIIQPREGKVYFPNQFERNHVDHPSAQKTNAWLVKWANNQSILCFSEKTANMLMMNIDYFPPEILSLPSEVDWNDVLATSDLDDVHNDIVERVKENYTVILQKLRTIDTNLFASIGGLKQEGDVSQSEKDFFRELNIGLGRLLILEGGNPNQDQDLVNRAYQYLIDMRFLYENHHFLFENHLEISADIEKITVKTDAIMAKQNAYIIPVLKQYIDEKFREIDKVVLDQGLSVKAKLEMKQNLLESIERVSDQENLYLGVKKDIQSKTRNDAQSGIKLFEMKKEQTSPRLLGMELSVNFQMFARYMDEKIQALSDTPNNRPF